MPQQHMVQKAASIRTEENFFLFSPTVNLFGAEIQA
jgi:hypothetical protein